MVCVFLPGFNHRDFLACVRSCCRDRAHVPYRSHPDVCAPVVFRLLTGRPSVTASKAWTSGHAGPSPTPASSQSVSRSCRPACRGRFTETGRWCVASPSGSPQSARRFQIHCVVVALALLLWCLSACFRGVFLCGRSGLAGVYLEGRTTSL